MSAAAQLERNYIVEGIPSTSIDDFWPYCKQWIQDALDRGSSCSIEDIYNYLICCDMQLWIVLDHPSFTPVACYTTEINETSKGRVLNTVTLGGNGIEKWLDEVEGMICAFAKDNGCNMVSMEGRKGWLKKLDKYGWGESTVRMVKELSYE